jgi:hypothetical protein
VRFVRSASIAEFFEFQTIRSLLLIFGGLVIAVFALLANQCNVISWHNSSTKLFKLNRKIGEAIHKGIA